MHNYSFRVHHLQIPFKYSYEHNLAKRSTTDSSILELTLNDIVSFGESTPREYVTDETTSGMSMQVETYLPQVLEAFDGTFSGLGTALNLIPSSLTALKCLIESALLCYLVKANRSTFFQLFDARDDKMLRYSASITGGSEDSFQKMAMLASQNQMTSIKLKVTSSPEQNLSRVQHIRNVCGDTSNIRMDGNEIWTFDQAKQEIPQLIESGVTCFEQLFHRDDTDSYDKAYKEWGKDCEFIVDESITDIDSLNRLIQTRNAHGACLKIAKNGGLIESLRFAEILQRNELSVRLGCHVGETSYLSLLGLVFGCITNPKDSEGALSPLLLEYDPFAPNIAFGPMGDIKIDDNYRNKFGANIDFKLV